MPSDSVHIAHGPDISSGQDFAAGLAREIEPGATAWIDTAHWTRCDLAGLGVLLSAFRTAEARSARLEITLPDDGVVVRQMRACGIVPDTQLVLSDGLWTGLAPAQTEGA